MHIPDRKPRPGRGFDAWPLFGHAGCS